MKVFWVVLLPVVFGRDCKFMPFDCSDIYNSGRKLSGIYPISPAGDVPVWVYCHMVSEISMKICNRCKVGLLDF